MLTQIKRTLRAHTMPFGAETRPNGAVLFRLWAPAQQRVLLIIEGLDDALPMKALAEGWHEIETDTAAPGTQYLFELADGMRVPDPASRHQPQDVHGPSEVINRNPRCWRFFRSRSHDQCSHDQCTSDQDMLFVLEGA